MRGFFWLSEVPLDIAIATMHFHSGVATAM